jgi:hypothetical protein
MKTTVLPLTAALMIFSAPAFAQGYQWEINLERRLADQQPAETSRAAEMGMTAAEYKQFMFRDPTQFIQEYPPGAGGYTDTYTDTEAKSFIADDLQMEGLRASDYKRERFGPS